MSKLLSWWSKRNQKRQSSNDVQEFTDNWKLLNGQNEKSCKNQQPDLETCTRIGVLVDIGADDNLQTFSEESEDNESDCVNIPAEIKSPHSHGNAGETSRPDESENASRIIKLVEMDTIYNCVLSDLDETSYLSTKDESEKNDSRTEMPMDLGTGTKLSDESEGNETDCANMPAEVEHPDLQVHETGIGTDRRDDESVDETRVVKLIEMGTNNESFLDAPDEMSFFSIEDESEESDSSSEILERGTNDKPQQFSVESEVNGSNCASLPTEITECENETRSKALMEIGTKDELQRFSQELEGNKSDCANISVGTERCDVQVRYCGPSKHDESEVEKRIVKLMELDPSNGSFMDVPDETTEESKENESRAETIMETGTNDNLQTISEELEENETGCENATAKAKRTDVQGSVNEKNRQANSKDEVGDAKLMDMDTNSDSFLLASDVTNCFPITAEPKENESHCSQDSQVSTSMEKSDVQCTASLTDTKGRKKCSGKRQISTPPVRRSSRLKTRGQIE